MQTANLPSAVRSLALAMLALILAAGAWSVGYLYFAVPDAWFDTAQAQHFNGAAMKMSRGTGHAEDGRFLVQTTDAGGVAIVSLETPALRSSDYRRVRWVLAGTQPDIELSMLWRTDYAPGRVNSVALENIGEGGQALLTPGERNWIGRITGLALMVRGTLRQPLVIENIHVEPINAYQVLRDRARDWFHFAPWNGLSINSAIGGPDEQAVWLPVTVALIALTAIALCIGWQRWRAKPAYPLLPLAIGAIVLVAWGALDARWLWARAQQTQATAASFAGKSARDKHLADADGEVYAFAEQVRAKLPVSPARIYITADDQFLRARLAYDLYPHNVYVNHSSGDLPPRADVKPGEYIAVFLRHGVEYDSAQQLLRWDGQPAVRADLLLASRGSALFKVL